MAADRELTEFNAPHLARFADLLRQAEASGRLQQLVLVAYQGGVPDIDELGANLQRVMVRPVVVVPLPASRPVTVVGWSAASALTPCAAVAKSPTSAAAAVPRSPGWVAVSASSPCAAVANAASAPARE